MQRQCLAGCRLVDELRHERQEEQYDLRVEHSSGSPAQQDGCSGAVGSVPWACAAVGFERSSDDAHVHEIGGAGVFDDRERQGGGRQDRRQPEVPPRRCGRNSRCRCPARRRPGLHALRGRCAWRVYSESAPGVMFSSSPERMNSGRSWMPSMDQPMVS